MRKLCVITSTRAEYGFYLPLLDKIQKTPDLKLQIIATGMHLSPEFGSTYRTIEQHYKIDKKIETLLSSDTSAGVCKTMGLTLISFAEALEELAPDIVLIAGDRYEMLAAASAAAMSHIPIAHFSGGEITEGALDDSIRHAITKLSHIHFTATEEYRKRVIQMGENPAFVFNAGEPGLENIETIGLLDKETLEQSMGLRFGPKNLLVTYHPETRNTWYTTKHFQALLDALENLEKTTIIFTKANSDEGGRRINAMIEEFAAAHENSFAFTSLGQQRYLSALQFIDAVVGNSSSGIIEAPSFKIATINIGERQKGRVRADSILDTEPDKQKILDAIETIYTEEFQNRLKHVENPYYQAGSSDKVVEVLRRIDLRNLQKKIFYDIDSKKPDGEA